MIREEAINKWIIPAIRKTWNDKKCEEIIKAIEPEPCEDAISRQAVIDINESHHGQMPNNINHQIWEEIKALPHVTPAEKVGHWIGIDEEPHEDYECDRCGYTISTYTANIEPHTEYKYCPNCGAKMESEDKE